MAFQKSKSTGKILDYLQAKMPGEDELTATQPRAKKPGSVKETPELNALDQDFNDSLSPTIDEAVEPVNTAEVTPSSSPMPTPGPVNKRKRQLIESMKKAFG